MRLKLFGRRFELTTKALTAPNGLDSTRGGWWPLVVREPYAGAWQVNVEGRRDQQLAYSAVFSCVTLIASDIGKLCLRLVEKTADDIWVEAQSNAFSPVLRKPNRYQTINKFVEQWISSKLTWGNTYVLKQRDARGVVIALYVLDPCRVKPLVAPDGGVYYELRRDDLSGDLAGLETESIIVPAREIIHDTMICLFHPLVGVSPIYACGSAAMQGLAIQSSSTNLFTNGGRPSGLITAPTGMTPEQLTQLRTDWKAAYGGPENAGAIAAFTADLKYTQLTMNAVDAQLIEQLKWTAETVCSCYHVQPYMISVGPPPPYANVEPLLQQYYSQCIQSLLTNFEKSLDEGLGILEPVNGTQYGTEFDIDDLIWMDTATKTQAAKDAIGSGSMSPDEARRKYYGLGPVTGGDTPYMQQQMFSLEALSERDTNEPFAKVRPAPQATPAVPQAAALTLDQIRTRARLRLVKRSAA